MKKMIFSNILGTFVFDENIRLIEKIKSEDSRTVEIKKEELKKILLHFKNNKYFPDFHKKNLLLTKRKVKESVGKDILIIQTISSLEEQNRVINILMKRLREWYSLYNPEFSKSVHEHESFVELVIKKGKKELLKQIKIKEDESMGADLRKEDLDAILGLAKEIVELYKLKERHENYLEKMMKSIAPNLTAVAGSLLGAKLIHRAGSLERLSRMPASTIQLLGAEKALFRHMTTGSKVPKHGVIIQHPLIANAPQKMHGKIARALADKICIAVKVDYFKGEFIGDELKKKLMLK